MGINREKNVEQLMMYAPCSRKADNGEWIALGVVANEARARPSRRLGGMFARAVQLTVAKNRSRRRQRLLGEDEGTSEEGERRIAGWARWQRCGCFRQGLVNEDRDLYRDSGMRITMSNAAARHPRETEGRASRSNQETGTGEV